MSRTPRRRDPREWLLTAPSLLWLGALVLVPTLIVFAVAFRGADLYGGVGQGWTLLTASRLLRTSVAQVAWRTLYLSFLTAAVCLLLATPTAYFMARAPARWRHWLLLGVVIPFWTSFLIRIFAFKVLLHPEGLIKRALASLGLVDANATLLYNPGAVLLVMVYTSLPFAILPIFAAAEKFDFGLVEAARDLGATSLQAFFTVFLPGVGRGLVSAALLVFVPSLGSYIVPDLVGGPSSEMVGNLIARSVFVDRNLPQAAALSAALTLVVLLPMLAILLLRGGESKALPREGP